MRGGKINVDRECIKFSGGTHQAAALYLGASPNTILGMFLTFAEVATAGRRSRLSGGFFGIALKVLYSGLCRDWFYRVAVFVSIIHFGLKLSII